MRNVFTREVRKWIYAVALAGFPVAIFYGLIDPKAAPLWLVLLLALLNLTPADVEGVPDGTGRYRANE